MTPSQYSELANRTCKHITDPFVIQPAMYDLLHATLGMSGESGEVVEHVKKALIYGKPLDTTHLKGELGDLLWYLNAACIALGITLEEVMEYNIAKLQKRYPDTYTDAAAIARVDKLED